MVFTWGIVRAGIGPGSVEDEGREVHGNEAVKTCDGGLAGFKGENHVPNCGCIERSKPGA